MIVVGVGQAEELSEVAEALAGVIEASGLVLPFQHRVQLCKWADLSLEPARERLEMGDADLEREYTSGAGDWDYMSAIATIGMLAVRTGQEALVEMFCRQVW